MRPRLVRSGAHRAAGVRRGGRRHRRLQLGLRPVPLPGARGLVRRRPGGRRARRRVPRDGRGAARHGPPGRARRGVQPHRRSPVRARSRCSTRSCRATTSGSTRWAASRPRRAARTSRPSTRPRRSSWSTRSCTWARDYKVDGFRFDLMGHHSKANMLAIAGRARRSHARRRTASTARRSTSTARAGTSARSPTTPCSSRRRQGNLGGTGIGTFSDRLRDAVHGGSPVDSGSTFRQGYGTGLGTDPNGDPINGTTDQALADLRTQTDLVKLGLAGNLRAFELTAADGSVKRGDELSTTARRPATPTSPTRSSPTSTRTTTRRCTTCRCSSCRPTRRWPTACA